MIDQPSQEADQEHDILKRQRMPMIVEAQKLAMWDDLVIGVGALSFLVETLSEQLQFVVNGETNPYLKAINDAKALFKRARAIK